MARSGSPVDTGGRPAASDAVADVDNVHSGGLDSLLQQLESDDSLQVFIAPDFSPIAHAGAAIHGGAVAASLAASEAAAARLSATVRAEVVRRKEALLDEVAAVSILEGEVSTLATGVGSLSAASAGLSSGLAAPHVPLRMAAAKLGHIHHAIHLLRLVVRFRRAIDRLVDARLVPAAGRAGSRGGSVIDASVEGTEIASGTSIGAAGAPAEDVSGDQLVAAADAIRELDEMLGGPNGEPLSQLDAVRPELPAVRAAGVALRLNLSAVLAAALDSRDGTVAAVALSGWHALGGLGQAVVVQYSRVVADVSAVVNRGLNPPSSASRPLGGGAVGPSGSGVQQLLPTAREVWAGVDKMMERLAELASAAILLQVTLMKTYDDGGGGSGTYAPLLASTFSQTQVLPWSSRKAGDSGGSTLPSPSTSLSNSIIDAIAARLAGAVATLASASSLTAAGVRFSTLVGDYPRLASTMATVAYRIDAAARGATARFVPVTVGPSFGSHSEAGESAAGATVSAAATVLPSRDVVMARLTASVRAVGERHAATSLERVTAPLRILFGNDGRLPDEADATAFVSTLGMELAAACEGGETLWRTAVANVLRALRLFTARAEATAAASPFVAGNGGGPALVVLPVSALGRWRMAPLYNSLVTVATAAERGLGCADRSSALPAGLGVTLGPALVAEAVAMRTLAALLLKRLFAQVTPSIAGVLSDVHDEPWGHGADGGAAAFSRQHLEESPYITDAVRRLRVFHAGVIVRVVRSPALAVAIARLASTMLTTWIVHVSCLRGPVTSTGRAFLTADATVLAAAVDRVANVQSLDALLAARGAFSSEMPMPASSAFTSVLSAVGLEHVAATAGDDVAVAALAQALDGLPPSAAARCLLFRACEKEDEDVLPTSSKLLIPPRRVCAGDGAAYARQLLAAVATESADARADAEGGLRGQDESSGVAGDPGWADVAAGLTAHDTAAAAAHHPPAAEAALVRSLTPALLRQWRERGHLGKEDAGAD